MLCCRAIPVLLCAGGSILYWSDGCSSNCRLFVVLAIEVEEMNKWFKFAERNAEKLEELDKFIEENRGKLRALLMDADMLCYLQTLDKFEEYAALKLPKYNGIRIIIDQYQPHTFISFLYRDQRFVLNVPYNSYDISNLK